AIITTGLHAIFAQRGSRRIVWTAILAVLGIAATAIAYIFFSHLTDFFHQLGARVPKEVSDVLDIAAPVVALWVVFGLVISQRWTLSRSWRLIILSGISGWLLTIF